MVLVTGATDVFTVPAQYVAVIRDVEVYAGTVSAVEVSANLKVPGPLILAFYVVNGLEPGTWAQWTGRVVANAGETLTLGATVDGPIVTASGYLLSSP